MSWHSGVKLNLGYEGFTLIELLVVISIIGILSSLLLPTLATSKSKAQGVYCMNNSKQIALGIHLYTTDHRELYPPNPDDNTTMDNYSWCGGSVLGGMGGIPPASETFNPDILKNEKKSLIIAYVKEVDLFKCPSDPRVGVYSGANLAMKGQVIRATRSISMNHAVGTIDPAYSEYQADDNHSGVPNLAVNGPWLDGKRSHHRNQPYATFGKTTDFNNGSPSQIFLTVDESPWSINDAAFGVSAAMAKWVDWPSVYHNNACGFSFCDGHAEIHKWQTQSLKTNRRTPPTMDTNPDNPDWIWLKEHSTVKVQAAASNSN